MEWLGVPLTIFASLAGIALIIWAIPLGSLDMLTIAFYVWIAFNIGFVLGAMWAAEGAES